MKTVLIDTNALITMAQERLDIEQLIKEKINDQVEIAILQATLDELDEIESEQRARFARAAVLAKKLLKAKQIRVIDEVGYVDDLLVERAQNGALVLTLDKELKSRLPKPYLTIRQRKYITLIQ